MESKYKYPEKEGLFKDMPEEEYFSYEAASNSGLRGIRRSPAHYRYEKDNPRDPTPAMRDGKALHMAILEPERFSREYAVIPDNAPPRPNQRQRDAKKPSEATVAAIQYWDMFERQYGSAEVVSQEKYDGYLNCAKTVMAHPLVTKLMAHGTAESSVFAKDPVTGVWCKCRPDWMTTLGDSNVMAEFKSTTDPRTWSFQRTAYDLDYFKAAAFYCDVLTWAGMGAPDLYLIVAFEKEAPYGVKVYEIPEQDILRGRDQYREALETYASCLGQDKWPAYDVAIEQLTFPAWAKD